ncbi:MAG: hypothetical protein WBC18_14745 [Ottowia sp.]
MTNLLADIVLHDRWISEALQAQESARLEEVMRQYRLSSDKEAFVGCLATKLLMERARNQLMQVSG